MYGTLLKSWLSREALRGNCAGNATSTWKVYVRAPKKLTMPRLSREHAAIVTVPLGCLRLGRARGTPASMLMVDTLSIEACRGHLSLPDESQLIT